MWRERAAVGSFLVMESLIWFVIASMMAAGAGGRGPSFLTVLLATLGGFGLTRALQHLDLSRTALVIAGAGGTVLGLTVLLNLQYNFGGSPLSFSWLAGFADSPDGFLATRWPQTWGVLIVAAAWLRSVYVAQRDFGYGLVATTFTVGLLLFVFGLLFTQGTNVGDRVNLSALPFFMVGLFALALLQLRQAEQSDAAFTRGPWLPIVLGTVGALGVISAAVGLFPLGLFYRLLAPVGVLALRLLDLVILAIALPIGWLATFILSRLLGRDGIQMPEMNRVATEGVENVQQTGERSVVLSFLLVLVKFFFVLAVLATIALVLYLVFRRLRRPARTRDEVRESIEREGSLGDDLNALLRGLLGRFNRPARGEHEPPLPENIRRLRRLYVGTLDDAEARGTTRPPSSTPHEFSPALNRTYDSEAPARLSDRFAAGRYGLVNPSAEELSELEGELEATRRNNGR